MADEATELREFVNESFADDPLLSRFAKPVRSFLPKGADLDTSFDRLANRLSKARLTGVVQLSIRQGRRRIQRCLVLSPNGCEAANATADHPDLEVITDAGTWTDIARGELSPLEAFGSGKLRVRGDIRFAQLLASKLRR
ncbi:MAG: SCP2 sterol-binding domain-containing protein [Actinobacteria bacterium]|nr:SCP2 sterol-binding domain-containing protein [Actinomycetota bacterium]